MTKLPEMALTRPPATSSSRAGSGRRALHLLLPLLVMCAYVALSMMAPFWMTGGVDGNSSPSTGSSGGETTAVVSVIPPSTPSTPAPSPEPSPGFGDSVVMLVSLEDGAAGEAALVEWASSAADTRSKLPAVWIPCYSNSTLEAAVRKHKTPNIFPFVVNRTSSWTETFDSFLSQNEHASLVGLFAEGSVPHVGLSDSIHSLVPALSQPKSPTAVLVRSRSRGDGGDDGGRWLPDAFVAQVWCNRAVLEPRRLEDVLSVETGAVREQRRVSNDTLLEVLPSLLTKSENSVDVGGGASRSGLGIVLVDGTNVLRSTFASVGPPSGGWSDTFESRSKAEVQKKRYPSFKVSRKTEQSSPNQTKIHIGNSKFAVVLNASGLKVENRNTPTGSMIVKAPWPPMYVLETAASILRPQIPAGSPRGLVLVTNVNCGYLDMAANLLMSVRKTTDAKILFVAMDEVAFDFLDDLAPGCTVIIPDHISERRHAARAGSYGDDRFAAEVLLRPFILEPILDKNFAVLWTDSDMVWLKDPFPLLPDIGDASTAEVALQHDGSERNKCTCFLFLKPTSMVRALVENWRDAIAKDREVTNQAALQHPLSELEALGMLVDVIPQEVFPSGKDVFRNAHSPNYTILEKTMIVHNNWIIGHESKKARFVKHHLWYVDAMPFPDCGRDKPGNNPWDKGKRWSDIRSFVWLIVLVLGCGSLAVMAAFVFLNNSPRVRESPPSSLRRKRMECS